MNDSTKKMFFDPNSPPQAEPDLVYDSETGLITIMKEGVY